MLKTESLTIDYKLNHTIVLVNKSVILSILFLKKFRDTGSRIFSANV